MKTYNSQQIIENNEKHFEKLCSKLMEMEYRVIDGVSRDINRPFPPALSSPANKYKKYSYKEEDYEIANGNKMKIFSMFNEEEELKV
jgi:hypothetical protein